jgi:hypothetical protein
MSIVSSAVDSFRRKLFELSNPERFFNIIFGAASLGLFRTARADAPIIMSPLGVIIPTGYLTKRTGRSLIKFQRAYFSPTHLPLPLSTIHFT